MADMREIGRIRNGMSGGEKADRWTRQALSTDEGWALARRLARRILVVESGEWRKALPEPPVIR
ncbi:hypothetical protein AB0H23_32660 [Streptomyces albogriseolus]|uniref:hypothetical protein n=1 Tax=Streptomyces albogriseolus TaxID=1887 RepID=UPI00345F4C1F